MGATKSPNTAQLTESIPQIADLEFFCLKALTIDFVNPHLSFLGEFMLIDFMDGPAIDAMVIDSISVNAISE